MCDDLKCVGDFPQANRAGGARPMPHIRWVEDEQATGVVAEVYQGWLKANPGRERMPDILKCFSLRPDFLQQVMDASYGVHFSEGHLTRRIKEMIATLVSGLNQCPY
jgi:hypothetical protein